ncbi:MAG: hypothetical protein HYS57_02435 [Parcubacteria group bacterium]|nr:hypothetical protein [Parcubacteria group bacterium]
MSPLLAFILVSSVRKAGELREAFEALRQEATIFEKENAKLRNAIQYFSLRANIEREARLRLNLARQGESVVVFISPSPSPSESPSTKPLSRFLQWLRRWRE